MAAVVHRRTVSRPAGLVDHEEEVHVGHLEEVAVAEDRCLVVVIL